jgi:transglutaminase-like putative cysteine protease
MDVTVEEDNNSAVGDSATDNTLTYDLEQRVRLINTGDYPAKPVKLWVALIQDLPPYQAILSQETEPVQYELITDEYDNPYALFTFNQLNAGEETLVTLRYRVELAQVQADLGDCQGNLPDTDIYPEKYVESDAPEIVDLANELSAGKQNACEISRAIYDYVGDNMEYSTYNPDDLGALAALEKKAGDCTEFSDLLVALHRAAGIPARMIDGVNCCTLNGYAESQNKHNWAEVYLPGSGWVQMDPTWGRDPLARDQYFASATFDHFLISRGRSEAARRIHSSMSWRIW